MNVQIRPLRLDDIKYVAEIDRQAFPTLWPPTPFKRELDNRQAKYLVAFEPRVGRNSPGSDGAEGTGPGPVSLGGSLVGLLSVVLKGRITANKHPVNLNDSLLGFVGLWFMAGEAHITAIAVEEASRGKGIGELLLIGSIELAMDRRATEVSLEARVSNHVAQSLYRKFGFEEVGVRKGYYTDNREDAVIMTTQPISTPDYREKFRGLRDAYTQRHGDIRLVLS